jgi:hypothetical protein
MQTRTSACTHAARSLCAALFGVHAMIKKHQKSTPEKMQTKMSLCKEPSMSLIIILFTTKTRKVPRRCVSVFSDFFQRLCTCFVLQIVKAVTETKCRVCTVCTHARDPILRHVLTVWVQQHSLLSRARLVCMHRYCVHAPVPVPRILTQGEKK